MSESGVNTFVKQMLDSRLENDSLATSTAGRSVGAMLSAARIEREWTVQQVADQLKLSIKQIAALEGDQFDDLPKLVIVRGFVRTYAKLLKIDADVLVALLPKDVQNIHLQETLKPALSTPFMESRLSLMGRQDSNKKYMLGAALLALFAAGFFVVQKTDILATAERFFKGQAVSIPEVKLDAEVVTPPVAENIQPTSESRELVTPHVLVVPESEKMTDHSVQVVPPPNISAVVNNEVKKSPEVLSNTAAVVTAAGALDKDMMKLKFRQDSWIQVRKENGVILTSHLAKAGTEEVFSVKELLQVRIGNAAGVEGILRGAPLEILAEKGSNVVNLNVK